MAWLSLVLLVIKFLNSLTAYLHDRQIIKAAEAEATQKILTAARGAADDIKSKMDDAARAATPPVGVPVKDEPYQRD